MVMNTHAAMNTCARNRAEDIPKTRVKTLVVDDSPFMLKILAQILEEAGNFDLVGTATDGCQALRYVTMLSPELVLMDVHMPRLNGIQATRCIKQREHPPVVIITTSDDSSVAKTTADDAGADGFVSKKNNLRHRMLGTLQELFGSNGARRAKAGRIASYKIPIILLMAGLLVSRLAGQDIARVSVPPGASDLEIQRAFDCLPDVGGEVVLSPGTYTVTQPIVLRRSGQTLRGYCPATCLRLADQAQLSFKTAASFIVEVHNRGVIDVAGILVKPKGGHP